uniref:DUF834 domain-containing protein n=1 Tax=Oryza rufipogon TaxID=4529 RepID=A0A0E0QIG7_ORYRU
MMGGTQVGWQTGRWGDDLDDGDTCGLGAIAIFSPGLDNMSVLLAVRPAGEEGFKLWTKVHRGERSQVVVPSGGTEDFRKGITVQWGSLVICLFYFFFFSASLIREKGEKRASGAPALRWSGGGNAEKVVVAAYPKVEGEGKGKNGITWARRSWWRKGLACEASVREIGRR